VAYQELDSMALQNYQRALVTGATSGIGSATVRRLAERRIEVHAVGRRGERLQALAVETGCIAHTLDLTDIQAVRELGAAARWDVIVNNAGVLFGFEGLAGAQPEDIDRTMDTNVRALYHLLAAALPGMQDRGYGHVINLVSMVGLHTVPGAIYSGSKAAVHMLSRSLRMELHGSGVKVTEIAPGRVKTEIYEVGIHDDATRQQLLDTRIDELTPEDVADAILYALDTPPRVNVNLLELQPTEQTYGGSQFVPRMPSEARSGWSESPEETK